jgi:hypothetical protein
MNTRALGMISMVVGVALLLLSVLADSIGIGGSPGFGPRQIIGAVAGAIVALAGFVLVRKV